jgi:hypothetical protein
MKLLVQQVNAGYNPMLFCYNGKVYLQSKYRKTTKKQMLVITQGKDKSTKTEGIKND